MATSTPIVNEALAYILVFSFLLFFAIVFLMVYFVVRYRRSRNPVPSPISGNLPLEILWIVLPTVIVLTMFVYGLTGFTFLRSVPADSLKITVISRQWSWLFQYENGVKSRDLVVPAGKSVDLELSSQDVIHSFFVPAFRIKQDCVPGMRTRTWFKALQTGTYDILCAEYCGTLHSSMLAKLVVVPQAQFDTWYAGQGAKLPGASPTPVAAGQQILEQKGCLGCHTLDGSAGAGPTLKGLFDSQVQVVSAGTKRTITADKDYCRKSILDPGADIVLGYSNIMPSGKGQLSEEEIGEVIEFMQSLR
jgi:cytochrome c oxidase subunit 2